MDNPDQWPAIIEHLKADATLCGLTVTSERETSSGENDAIPLDHFSISTSSTELRRLRTAQAWQRADRIRSEALGPSLDSDVAWHIALGLYMSGRESRICSVTHVADLAKVPRTTGLRRIHHLEGAGWIVRSPDQTDERRSFVRLTIAATSAVEWALDRAVDSDQQIGLD